MACAGANQYGQLGLGTTAIANYTPQTIALRAPNADVFAGAYHSCAVHTDGRVACWGNNDFGQLGVTTSTTCRAFGTDFPCARAPMELAAF